MFDNIGGKIKDLAGTLLWIGIGISVIAGILIIGFSYDGSLSLIGFLVIIIGSYASLIGSYVLYGFGELVDNSDKIVTLMESTKTKE